MGNEGYNTVYITITICSDEETEKFSFIMEADSVTEAREEIERDLHIE